jgi:predicted GNAT family N-acyltransferase
MVATDTNFQKSLVNSSNQDQMPMKQRQHNFTIRLCRSLSELDFVFNIRRKVFIEECGYEDYSEFDGNDLCATHLIAFVDGVPAACVRFRYFGDFAVTERFAVLPEYRRSKISFVLARPCMAFLSAKQFRTVYGIVREDFVNFWRLYGGFARPDFEKIKLGRFWYVAVEFPLKPDLRMSRAQNDMMLMSQPEGFWQIPGGLPEFEVPKDLQTAGNTNIGQENAIAIHN